MNAPRTERRTVVLAAIAMTTAVLVFVIMDSLMRVVAREASVAVGGRYGNPHGVAVSGN